MVSEIVFIKFIMTGEAGSMQVGPESKMITSLIKIINHREQTESREGYKLSAHPQ